MKAILMTIAICLGAPAFADCPNKAPASGWNVFENDQRVNAEFLEKSLTGKRVRYSFQGRKSTETYRADGSYSYQDSSGTYTPSGYKFYNTGVRCLDYPNGPRFDLYVVNNQRLVLINRGGGRFEGKILR